MKNFRDYLATQIQTRLTDIYVDMSDDLDPNEYVDHFKDLTFQLGRVADCYNYGELISLLQSKIFIGIAPFFQELADDEMELLKFVENVKKDYLKGIEEDDFVTLERGKVGA